MVLTFLLQARVHWSWRQSMVYCNNGLQQTPLCWGTLDMTDLIPAGVNMSWCQTGTRVSAVMLTSVCVWSMLGARSQESFIYVLGIISLFQESYHCSIHNTLHQLYLVWARQAGGSGTRKFLIISRFVLSQHCIIMNDFCSTTSLQLTYACLIQFKIESYFQ